MVLHRYAYDLNYAVYNGSVYNPASEFLPNQVIDSHRLVRLIASMWFVDCLDVVLIALIGY